MSGASGARFLYRRREVSGAPGETVLDALSRDEVPTLVRSLRYHRPRAPLCGTGQCMGCLVRVNDRPNVRACRTAAHAGDRVESQNAWPSPTFDVAAVIDRLFPAGIDTLHGFVRPAFATRLYHRVIRRLSGFGPPPTEAASASVRAPAEVRDTEVVIVGAGRAGRAAARTLADRGARPLVVERSLAPAPVPGADVLAGTTATFLPPPSDTARPFSLLGFSEPARGVLVRARRVIVATGGYDAMLLFGGNDRPGVIAADLAMTLARPGRVPPFGRAVVVGGDGRARDVVERLGAAVVAVVSPGEISPELTLAASERRIPLYPRSLVLRVGGRARVRALSGRARAGGAEFRIPCDAVILAHRRLPNAQMFFQAGARTAWRSETGAYYPEVGADGRTTVPDLFAVGTAGGFRPEAAEASGERAAAAVLGDPRPTEGLARFDDRGPSPLEGYYRELLREPRRGRWLACTCEDVHLAEVESATAIGYRGIEVIKRYSGLGTGLCQGRYCLPDALLLLSIREGRPPPEVGYITQRPPLVPTPLAAFAGLPEGTPTEARA